MHISNIQEFLQKETEQLKTTDLYISDSNATTDDYIALFKICSHLRKLRINAPINTVTCDFSSATTLIT